MSFKFKSRKTEKRKGLKKKKRNRQVTLLTDGFLSSGKWASFLLGISHFSQLSFCLHGKRKHIYVKHEWNGKKRLKHVWSSDLVWGIFLGVCRLFSGLFRNRWRRRGDLLHRVCPFSSREVWWYRRSARAVPRLLQNRKWIELSCLNFVWTLSYFNLSLCIQTVQPLKCVVNMSFWSS